MAEVPARGWNNIEDEAPSRKRGRSPEPGGAPLATALPAGTRLAIMSAVAPTRSEAEIRDYRRQVLGAGRTKEFVIPSQVTPKYVCGVCGNRDQRQFLHESRSGDVVCLGADSTGCGNVVEEHKMHEGAQYRKFEGEDDKSHHGPAPNRPYSAAHNMRTSMVPMNGAGGATASRLRQTYDQVELGLSNLGNDERKTRVGYKDGMKKKAFDAIVHVASNLSLHSSVVNRAQALFANYRDEKEYVQRFDAVLAACVLQAAEEAAVDERTKQARSGGGDQAQSALPRAPTVTSARPKLLDQPLSSAKVLGSQAMAPPVAIKRARHPNNDPKPKPTQTIRAGKGWAAALDDLDDLDDDDDD